LPKSVKQPSKRGPERGPCIINLGIDTTTPAGRLIFTITGAVAAMEPELLIERTQSGLAAARARARSVADGAASPRRSSARHSGCNDLNQMTVEQIAKAIGSSSSTVYRYLQAGERSPPS
jgi:DNA invertase Pin-like site-specific DNA recombinase